MRIPAESLFTLLALFGLLCLGWVNSTPFFESLEHSRLAFLTIIALPVLVLWSVARGKRSRISGLVNHWWPVVGVLLVYESLKHMHANRITEWLGILPKDNLMLWLDEQMFFGKALPLWLEPLSSPGFTQVMWFFYVWLYYMGPVLLLGWAYFLREDELLFNKLRRGLVVGLLGGYVIYLLVPVEGPLFLIGEQFTRPILTQPVLQRLTFSTLRFNWDCFPSLHTAIPWLLTIVAWSRLPRLGRIIAIISATGITLATVVLRFHYGVDLVAGFLWAGLVWILVERLPSFIWSPEIPMPTISLLAVSSLRLRLMVLSLLFVMTGTAGLLAEQSFEKLLETLLGASTPAASVVLAVYFLGLTIGAACGGWLIKRSGNPLRLYAYLEGGIAFWALLLYLGFSYLTRIFVPFLCLGADRFWLLQCLRSLVALVWILPPTFLMGATFPAVVASLRDLRSPKPRKTMAVFYALNLLGAVLGSIVGPYIAFPMWGVDGTILFTFFLDGLVFLIAFRLAEKLCIRPTPEIVTGGNRDMQNFILRNIDMNRATLLAVAMISGGIFFSLEVVWTHLLSAVLGNSVYAFAAMLGLVLLGLWIGSILGSKLGKGDRPLPGWILAGLYFGGSALLMVTFDRWPQVPHAFTIWGLGLGTFAQGETLRWIQAGIQVLPPAIVLGMVYPSLFRLEGFPVEDRAAFVGSMGALNSVGCILGALITGFLVIPAWGSEICMLLLGILCVILGGLLAWRFTRGYMRQASMVIGIFLLIFWGIRQPWDLLALSSGEHVYFRPNQVWPQSQLAFFHEDTYGGITTVVQNPAGVRGQPKPYLTLLTNGKFQGNDSWETDAQTGFALIPILHVGALKDACVIGLGVGHSAQIVENMEFQHINVAEIAPGITEAAKKYFFHVNGSLLNKPNVKVVLEDGRNMLLLHPTQTYNLITMEVSSVWFAGSTNLYSQEFYQLVKDRLKSGGIFQQWIQLHHIGTNEVGSVIATLRSVFPCVSFWVFGGQGILVASKEPQEIQPPVISKFLERSAIMGIEPGKSRAYLKSVLASRLLAPEEVTRLVRSVRLEINTDRNRYLEYATPRYNLSSLNYGEGNVKVLGQFAKFPDHVLAGGDSSALADLVSGRSAKNQFSRIHALNAQ